MLVVIDEINDAEVVAGDWCETNAHDLLCIKWCGLCGCLGIETEDGFRVLTTTDLLGCYEDVVYLGYGKYSCKTLREIETLTDDECARCL